MSLMCKIGFHYWVKDCSVCSKCGKTRSRSHIWKGCKCTVCGKLIYGGSVDREDYLDRHTWGKDQCQKCGTPVPPILRAKRWADKCVKNNDYNALAKHFCTYHKTLPGEDYETSVHIWNEKNDYGRRALREIGSAAVDAIIAEMQTGEDGNNIYLAEILVDIGDTRAVPLLKTLADRNVWSAYGGNSKVEDFVRKYSEEFRIQENQKQATQETRVRTFLLQHPFLSTLEVSSVSDMTEFIIQMLSSACPGGSWISDQDPQRAACRLVGEELARRGGTSQMRQVGRTLLGRCPRLCSTLDVWWDGIAGWQG